MTCIESGNMVRDDVVFNTIQLISSSPNQQVSYLLTSKWCRKIFNQSINPSGLKLFGIYLNSKENPRVYACHVFGIFEVMIEDFLPNRNCVRIFSCQSYQKGGLSTFSRKNEITIPRLRSKKQRSRHTNSMDVKTI